MVALAEAKDRDDLVAQYVALLAEAERDDEFAYVVSDLRQEFLKHYWELQGPLPEPTSKPDPTPDAYNDPDLPDDLFHDAEPVVTSQRRVAKHASVAQPSPARPADSDEQSPTSDPLHWLYSMCESVPDRERLRDILMSVAFYRRQQINAQRTVITANATDWKNLIDDRLIHHEVLIAMLAGQFQTFRSPPKRDDVRAIKQSLKRVKKQYPAIFKQHKPVWKELRRQANSASPLARLLGRLGLAAFLFIVILRLLLYALDKS